MRTRRPPFHFAVLLLMLAVPFWLAGRPAPDPEPPPAAAVPGTFRLLHTETGTVEQLSAREYLIGCVAAEMPAAYEPAALRAQTIASHSYAEAVRRQKINAEWDISDDPAQYQAWYSEAQLHMLWGENYDASYAKIAAAVDAAGAYLLEYEGEPAAAAFHAVSPGQTVPAEHIWGQAVPYLTAVASPWDENAPRYSETVTFLAESLAAAMRRADPLLTLPADSDPGAWLGTAETDAAGYVLHLPVGDRVLTGAQLRTALGLRSGSFTVEWDGTEFAVTTKGWGHGAGMSQYGANAMAKNGSSCEEILAYYYPGTKLAVQK